MRSVALGRPCSVACPRGAARSARRPVKAKIVGSNPIGDARGTVCKSAKQRSSNLCDCGFESRLCHNAGLPPCARQTPVCRARLRVVILVAACKAVVTKQARWMTRGSIPSQPTAARSSSGRMRDPHSRDAGSIPARVTSAIRIRPRDGTGRHPTFRTSCHLWRGSSILPLVT